MKRRWIWAIGLAMIPVILSACGGGQPPPGEPTIRLQLESSAFQAEGIIPSRHTCDGEDLSPPLSWSEPPAGTRSLALICDDPDAPAGTWVHWVLFNLPAGVRSLPEGVTGMGVEGSNSWKRQGYGGPCPPTGSTHRYYFKLYALDTTLDLEAGAGKQAVEQAMQGHILAEGQLMGRYGRSSSCPPTQGVTVMVTAYCVTTPFKCTTFSV